MKKGWKTDSLGDLCEFQRGLTYAKGDEVDVSDNVVLRATNIDLATNLLNLDELRYINDKIVVPDSKKVRKGSLLICTASGSKSHLGKVAFIDDDYGYAFGGFMGMITPRNGLLPKFLFHLMTSDDYKDFIGELSDGANINNLKFDELRKFQIPRPPLAEQQRIVGVLDKAFAGLATAQAHAAKNLHNSRALFESYLDAVFSQHGPRWEEKRLGDLCDLITKGTTPTSVGHSFVPDGINFVKVESIARDGEFLSSRIARITQECHDALRRSQLMAGDILFSIAGALGRTAVVTEEILPANTNQALAILRLKPSLSIVPGFVRAVLSARSALDQIEAFRGGAAQQNLSLAQMREFVIPLPSPAEQRRVVSALNEIAAETQRLTRLYEQKQAALAALKKSLLHQAFTGNL